MNQSILKTSQLGIGSKCVFKKGQLQENFVKIGQLSLVTPNTLEPLLRKYFNPIEQALCSSLCKIFGMDEQNHIPISIIFIMA